jgi:hypothetical protein
VLSPFEAIAESITVLDPCMVVLRGGATVPRVDDD